MVKIYSAHLTLYNIPDYGIDPYPLAGHPDDPTLDIFSFPLQLKNYPALVSIYTGAADIGHYFRLLTKVVNDGLLNQFRWKGEFYSSFDHLIFLVLFPEVEL
jgi:hypothetical protein